MACMISFVCRELHATYRALPGSDTFLELRVGPYYPEIDAEFSDSAPFREMFGDDARLMVGFEADRKLFEIDRLASLWFGVAASYSRFGAQALLTDGSGGRAAEETSLKLLPLHALVALRATGLTDLEVPVVPFAKVGAGAGVWWSETGYGSEPGETHTAHGVSWGPYYGLGVLLLLDALDRADAAQLSASTGIEHSYVLFEWYTSGLGFYGDQMRVGARTWSVGLGFEL